MNNKCFIFKSYVLTWIYVFMTGGKHITQGPYNVIDLIYRFGAKDYKKTDLLKELVSVAYNYGKYNFHVDEYFMYNVKDLSAIGKRKFITEETRWGYYDKLNKRDNIPLFDDKEKCYSLFANYYHREVVAIKGVEDRNKYDDFILQYKKIILKPLSSSGGKGVRLFNHALDSLELLLEEYAEGFVMEPAIENSCEMAEFHKESLNTVRVATVRMDDRVEIGFAVARFGNGGACVDNFSHGGIIGVIDLQSGRIYASKDKRGSRYIVHPSSNKLLLGYQIPQWEELVALVMELAYIVPTNRYTGWDMAHTKDGWILVEANARGQFISQAPANEGIKERFDSYLKELGL